MRAFCPSGVDLVKSSRQFGSQKLEIRTQCRTSGDQNVVETRFGIDLKHSTHCFTKTSFDTISNDRISDLFCDCETNANFSVKLVSACALDYKILS